MKIGRQCDLGYDRGRSRSKRRTNASHSLPACIHVQTRGKEKKKKSRQRKGKRKQEIGKREKGKEKEKAVDRSG
jgi:hypothetical protein